MVESIAKFGLELTPGFGDVIGFVEAETPFDYLLATVGVVPGMGDMVSKGIKHAEGLFKQGKIAEATAALEQTKAQIPAWKSSDGPYSGHLSGDPKSVEVSYGGKPVESPNDYSGMLGPKATAAGEKVPQITLNRQNGVEFEKQVVAAFDHVGGVKNTTPVTVPVNGVQVTTIPDMWGKSVGGMLEVKNVQNLSMSNQLRAQIQHAGETGQPLNLVVSPRTTNVSRELRAQIEGTGGGIYRYNPSTGELTNF